MPLLDHFGIIAPVYDRLIRPGEPQFWIDLLKLPVQGCMLDAGGGTGRVAQGLGEYASPIVVADLSERMLRQAAAKDGLCTVCSHTETLPFSEATFDRIIIVDALHHVYDQAETAQELWRVLKPGGRLVIEEPDVRKTIVKLVALAEKIAFMRSHFISPPRILRLFQYSNAQLQIVREGYNAWVIVDKF
jgi:ubiquinone/menaquinone biosynthesis C-methylase UbiE